MLHYRKELSFTTDISESLRMSQSDGKHHSDKRLELVSSPVLFLPLRSFRVGPPEPSGPLGRRSGLLEPVIDPGFSETASPSVRVSLKLA